MPLPPADVPVPRDGDREHRLAQQHPRGGDRQRDGRAACDEESRVPEGGVAVEDHPQDPEAEQGVAGRLRRDRLFQRRQRPECHHGPKDQRGHHRAQQEPALAQDRSRRALSKGKRGGGGEAGCDQEPDRGRNLKAGVLPLEKHARRRQSVQAEESRRREERERDEQHPGVAPTPGRLGHEQAEQEAEERREEDEPEVRGLVLPGKVEVGDAEEEEKSGERDDEEPGRCGGASHKMRAELPLVVGPAVVVEQVRLQEALADLPAASQVDRRVRLTGGVHLDRDGDGVGPTLVDEVRQRDDVALSRPR